MSKLYFRIEDVRRVVADSKRATQSQRRPTFAQMLEAGASDDELHVARDEMDETHAKVQPALTLVHDKGIYLMPNAWFEGIAIAYAVGCNPKTDGQDVWDHCRDLVGGDVFAKEIPLKMLEEPLEDPSICMLILRPDSRGAVIATTSRHRAT